MAIYDLSKQQVVDYLADFEEKLPNLGNALYEPSVNFIPRSLDSLYVEATRIVQFLGIRDYAVRVDFADLSQRKAAGLAHFDDLIRKEFHITIDHNTLSNALDTLRVLAHEICHLYLKINGIYANFEKIDEANAELCTIYMGLGLLTLRGYKDNCGYLNLEDFCHAFCVVYKTRGMSDEQIVEIVPDNCKEYAKAVLHYMSEIQAEGLKDFVIRCQSSDYKFRRRVRILMLLFDNMPDLKEKHNLQDGMFRKRQSLLKDGKHPILELLLRETFSQNNLSDSRLDACCDEMDKLIDFMCTTMNVNLEIVSENMTKNVTCPACGKTSKKEIRDGLSLQRCLNCHHLFVWDASPVNLSTGVKKKDSFWNRLLHFGKK